MSRLFISHSSHDNAEAIAIVQWLEENGWPREDIFLDLDPERGISAGQRWETALRQAANRCEAVLFLISPAWLASSYCRVELSLARAFGKQIFGLAVKGFCAEDLVSKLPELASEYQLVNLSANPNSDVVKVSSNRAEPEISFDARGLLSLKSGLLKSGLGSDSFPFDPDRPLFRGLRPFDESDAAVFFGREGKIVEAVHSLKILAKQNSGGWLAITGASGTGKSSFLRAGLWPRLHRDDRNWLALPIVRPQRAVLSGTQGLWQALKAVANQHGIQQSLAAIEARCTDANHLSAFIDELVIAARLRLLDTHGATPKPLLFIDQSEELLGNYNAGEANQFVSLVASLVRAGQLWIISTVRTDALDALHSSDAFDGALPTVNPFLLPPMPQGAYKDVIEGPVRRLQASKGQGILKFDPRLTDAVLQDVSGEGCDALPLVSFTMERLLRKHNELTLESYQQSNGIQGALHETISEALANPLDHPQVSTDASTLKSALQRLLVPHLVSVDLGGDAVRRRTAALSDIPDACHGIAMRLVQARILIRASSDATNPTIELAHEILLRRWPLLADTVKDQHQIMLIADSLSRAHEEWVRHGRVTEWIIHRGSRLGEAEATASSELYQLPLLRTREYLEAARNLEQDEIANLRHQIELTRQAEDEVRRQLAQRIRTQRVLRGTVVFALLVFAFLLHQWLGQIASVINPIESKLMADAQEILKKDRPLGLKLALASRRIRSEWIPAIFRLDRDTAPKADAVPQSDTTVPITSLREEILGSQSFENGLFFATVSKSGSVKLWNSETSSIVKMKVPQEFVSELSDGFVLRKGDRLFAIASKSGVNVWNVSDARFLWTKKWKDIQIATQRLPDLKPVPCFDAKNPHAVAVNHRRMMHSWDLTANSNASILIAADNRLVRLGFEDDGAKLVHEFEKCVVALNSNKSGTLSVLAFADGGLLVHDTRREIVFTREFSSSHLLPKGCDPADRATKKICERKISYPFGEGAFKAWTRTPEKEGTPTPDKVKQSPEKVEIYWNIWHFTEFVGTDDQFLVTSTPDGQLVVWNNSRHETNQQSGNGNHIRKLCPVFYLADHRSKPKQVIFDEKSGTLHSLIEDGSYTSWILNLVAYLTTATFVETRCTRHVEKPNGDIVEVPAWVGVAPFVRIANDDSPVSLPKFDGLEIKDSQLFAYVVKAQRAPTRIDDTPTRVSIVDQLLQSNHRLFEPFACLELYMRKDVCVVPKDESNAPLLKFAKDRAICNAWLPREVGTCELTSLQ